MLEIFGNPYEKSEISYALGRNPFEKVEISYAKCGTDLPLDYPFNSILKVVHESEKFWSGIISPLILY